MAEFERELDGSFSESDLNTDVSLDSNALKSMYLLSKLVLYFLNS